MAQPDLPVNVPASQRQVTGYQGTDGSGVDKGLFNTQAGHRTADSPDYPPVEGWGRYPDGTVF